MDKVDFFTIDKEIVGSRQPVTILYPEFLYYNVQDLACKGGAMYAFWDGTAWSDNLNDLILRIDRTIKDEYTRIKDEKPDAVVKARYMNRQSSGVMKRWIEYTKSMPDSRQAFNQTILFADHEIKREDYATNKLPYTPKDIPTPNFDKMMDILYAPSEQQKIMWFVGAVLTNNMKSIQKFMFLYGAKGTGKGTVLKILEKLFEGYYSEMDLKLLTSASEFNTSQVKEIPVLIDYDTDLSNIKNDLDLLKLTGHEVVTVNKKYTKPYPVTFNGLLIAASNQRYKVRNVDAGIVRRAVTVEPTNNRVPLKEYNRLMHGISFELAGIAHKAMQMFEEMGPGYYEEYQDNHMLAATDLFYGFVQENYDKMGDMVTLARASELYKVYLDDLGFNTAGYKQKVKNELTRYYKEYHERLRVGADRLSRVFVGLKTELFDPIKEEVVEETLGSYVSTESYLDEVLADCPAQLANADGFPKYKWDNVESKLKDIDTHQLHFVRMNDVNHIVIDFDLKEDGKKSLAKNLEAASKFPETYGELSKSGAGIHLHYIYDGDVDELSAIYDADIEVKVYKGKSSLRRQFSRSNGVRKIAHISSGLPRKEENRKMLDNVQGFVHTERTMRATIERALRKEYHASTSQSVNLIVQIFNQAYQSGVKYDLSDMESDISLFASSSTNQAKRCLQAIQEIVYSTIEDDTPEMVEVLHSGQAVPNEKLTFFDVEVFKNLFMICWKDYGVDEIHTMCNPTPQEVENWLQGRYLVGFNNLRYDNHMVYSALLGQSTMDIYQRSQAIVNNNGGKGFHKGAYELSYLDLYEMASKKQSLKAWEIELGLPHDEFEYPWDEPLPENLWERCAEYCGNDVRATEALFDKLAEDYNARKILASLSGLSINTKTQNHAAEIIFEGANRPQDRFIYTDLSQMFPGYKFEWGKSEYRGEDPSEGGYVYSEPGVYTDVAVLDVASMHPTSLIAMNYFGPYTQNYADIREARILIKHGDLEKLRTIFDGKLAPYADMIEKGELSAKALSYALKIVINIVYGMTSAKFDNKFRHPDNVDNIVAKRGALFMIDLKHACQERGLTVAHIKTDSIKIPNATAEDIEFVTEFGKRYDYDFEHEHTYDRFALVNKAVNIGEYYENGEPVWEATGAQFKEPYVLKTLFTKDNLELTDFMTTKNSKVPMYLGDEFVGKTGRFYASKTGDALMKKDPKKDKLDAVTGTKGYKWKLDSELVDKSDIDMSYYDNLAVEAIKAIQKVGDIDIMIDDMPEQYLYLKEK